MQRSDESAETRGALPQFAPANRPIPPGPIEGEGEETPTGDSSPTTSEARSTSSPSSPPGTTSPGGNLPGSSEISSPESSDVGRSIDPELALYLGSLGKGLAQVAGVGLNKIDGRRRRGYATKRWLLTDEEAEGIGDALGRLAARRIPEELTEGDGGEILEIAAISAGYVIRNAVGVTADDLAGLAGAGQPPRPAPAPAPAPPPPPAPAPSAPPAAVHRANPFGAVAGPTELDEDRPATQASEVIGLL